MTCTRTLPGRRDLLALAAGDPSRYPALLESAAHNARSRYDVLFAFPREAIVLDARDPRPFLARLDTAFRAERLERTDMELPFRGGWCLMLGYELVRECEPKLRLPSAPMGLPTAIALRCTAGAVYDHERDVTIVFAESDASQLATVMDDLDRTIAAAARKDRLASPKWAPIALRDLREDDPQEFLAGVERIREYIAAGDVFQVNLSRAWRARLASDETPASLYAALRRANPSPFAGLFQWNDVAVVSSSPERLVCVHGDRVETRPIAGTRPRLPGDDEAARIRELIGHPKERAEHIMLIDLERNDLGRVCTPGSVEVDELMSIESYAHVHHIVSNVRGRLAPGKSPVDVIRAVFPGGTITGCPKVRCMEIIAELECEGRGPYTGALGYLNRDGDLDLNILIRTLWKQGDEIAFRAGSGIVADSVAEKELDETHAKARGLLRALGVAG